MILHHPKPRPEPWSVHRARLSAHWAIPFLAVEWIWKWVAYVLSNWSFVEVLEYLGSFSILIAVFFYYSESDNRLKQKHYQAWQVINTAQGKGGSGGRLEALEELNRDGVPLVGVDVSSAYLQRLTLEKAQLVRSNFSAADLRNSTLRNAALDDSNFEFANLRESDVSGSSFRNVNLTNADLWGADLSGADLNHAVLDSADLRGANLKGVQWSGIRSIRGANISGVKNAPVGFIEWAVKNSAEQLDRDAVEAADNSPRR